MPVSKRRRRAARRRRRRAPECFCIFYRLVAQANRRPLAPLLAGRRRPAVRGATQRRKWRLARTHVSCRALFTPFRWGHLVLPRPGPPAGVQQRVHGVSAAETCVPGAESACRLRRHQLIASPTPTSLQLHPVKMGDAAKGASE